VNRAVLALLLLAAPACASARAGNPREVTLTMHWSSFSQGAVSVPRGVPVRFVLRNDDPIDHEFIVGDAAMQARHEKGTEPKHGARPTEQSIAALTTVTTTITFTDAGTQFFACHLPGHYDYGMRGIIHVA